MSRHQIKVREAPGQELMVQEAIYKPATLIVQEAIMQPATTTIAIIVQVPIHQLATIWYREQPLGSGSLGSITIV